MLARMLLAGWLALAFVASATAMDYFPRTVRIAMSANPEQAEKAIAMLRAQGYGGLQQVLQMYDDVKAMLAQRADAEGAQALVAQLDKIEAVADKVAAQRYSTASRLFWYTDLEQAKSAAREANKPILCLRLLGQLTDEFSCANSRFFRTTLYANDDVSKYLREHYILYWKTVRPVPKVTIDFGDGRKLERTLTGNSIHYILDAEGNPIEALPGLYGPQGFLAGLNRAETLFTAMGAAKEPGRRGQLLVQYHSMRSREVFRAWQRDLAAVAPQYDATKPLTPEQAAALSGPVKVDVQQPAPPAPAAGIRAMTKSLVEMPILRGIAATPINLEEVTTDELWTKIAALHAGESKLDDASKAVIRKQNPQAAVAGRLAITKRRVEDPLVRLVRSLEESIALDAVKNEYLFHQKIHDWFVAGEVKGMQELNERVYAQLFLTPSSDPWLGLAPGDTYSALPNDGVVREQPATTTPPVAAPTAPIGPSRAGSDDVSTELPPLLPPQPTQRAVPEPATIPAQQALTR